MKGGNGGHSLVRELRLQIMASPQELKAVDTFRFEHGYRAGWQPFGSCCATVSLPLARCLKTPGLNPKTTGFSKRPKGWQIIPATHKDKGRTRRSCTLGIVKVPR